jgi:hypothetical protein
MRRRTVSKPKRVLDLPGGLNVLQYDKVKSTVFIGSNKLNLVVKFIDPNEAVFEISDIQSEYFNKRNINEDFRPDTTFISFNESNEEGNCFWVRDEMVSQMSYIYPDWKDDFDYDPDAGPWQGASRYWSIIKTNAVEKIYLPDSISPFQNNVFAEIKNVAKARIFRLNAWQLGQFVTCFLEKKAVSFLYYYNEDQEEDEDFLYKPYEKEVYLEALRNMDFNDEEEEDEEDEDEDEDQEEVEDFSYKPYEKEMYLEALRNMDFNDEQEEDEDE